MGWRAVVVEVKLDADLESESVKGKREAALRWANHVNYSDEDHHKWGYVLAGESDIATARGTWSALGSLDS